MLETEVNNIREKIDSGEISDVLSLQKYNRHVAGAPEFERYTRQQEQAGKSRPSKIYLSYAEAQEAIRTHAGTGTPDVGTTVAEFVSLNRNVGEYEERGVYFPTRRMRIVYGNRNAHLFPVKERE